MAIVVLSTSIVEAQMHTAGKDANRTLAAVRLFLSPLLVRAFLYYLQSCHRQPRCLHRRDHPRQVRHQQQHLDNLPLRQVTRQAP